jgi:hypothetical protein
MSHQWYYWWEVGQLCYEAAARDGVAPVRTLGQALRSRIRPPPASTQIRRQTNAESREGGCIWSAYYQVHERLLAAIRCTMPRPDTVGLI